MISAPPYSVSSDFGQLVGMRHLISGIDCAIAGAAMVAAPPATPIPVTLIKSRRFIEFFLLWVSGSLLSRLEVSMEHPVADFHGELGSLNAKARPLRAGL